jgi:hypothetical protein
MEYSHGTIERYKRGCHCADCKAANAARIKHWRHGGLTDRTIKKVRDHAPALTPKQAGMLGEALAAWAARIGASLPPLNDDQIGEAGRAAADLDRRPS